MKLSTKLALTMAVLMCMQIGLGIFGIYMLNSMNKYIIEFGDERLPSNRLLQTMTTYFSDMRMHLTYMALTDNKEEHNKRIKSYTDLRSKYLNTQSDFDNINRSPEMERLYKDLKVTQKEYSAAVDKLIDTVRAGRMDEAEKDLEATIPSFYKCNDTIEEMIQLSIKMGFMVKNQAHEAYAMSKTLMIIIMIVMAVIAAIIAILITRNVLTQLGKDPGVLDQIAQKVVEGNFDIDDGSPKQGVYGNIVEMVASLEKNIENANRESENAKVSLAKAEKAMLEAEAAQSEAQAKTNAMLVIANQLEAVGNVVSSASTELSAQIEQSDRGSTEAAQRLSEAATAMNEMNATVQEVARNAASASQASLETKEKAIAGAHVVEQSVHSIAGVHQRSLELKNDMTKLNEHAQDISRIMGVISDIADQTNLLALNAAIEAARAGEAGRGFAVVADEVRKLAEKTMSSTQDVGSAIKSIQESTAKSMEGMNQALVLVEQATQLANQSGQALQEIVATVEATADQVNAIATASEEQSAASEEINQSIDQVNDVARQTASAMGEAAKAVSDLNIQAHELSQVIGQLKNA